METQHTQAPRYADLTCHKCSNNFSRLEFGRQLASSLKESANFECPACFLQSQDPFYPVVKSLIPPRLVESEKRFPVKLDEATRKSLLLGELVCQVRCMKLDSKAKYITKFPDKCSVSINGTKLKVFQPLDVNISTRVRKDEKIDVTDLSFFKEDTIVLNIDFSNEYDESGKNSTKPDKPLHFFTLVLVRRLTHLQLQNYVMQNHVVSEEESKKRILNFFRREGQAQGLGVSRERISALCPISTGTIQHPGRGRQCQHLQLFCLKSMLQLIERNIPRNWNCPICKFPCHELVYEPYFEAIIKEADKLGKENLFFLEDGTYTYEEPPRKKTPQDRQNIASIVEDESPDTGNQDNLSNILHQAGPNRDPVFTLELYEQTSESLDELVEYFKRLDAEEGAGQLLEDLAKRLAEPFNIDVAALPTNLFD